MRKIANEAYEAFINCRPFAKSNVRVKIINGEPVMSLFGNEIVKLEDDDLLVCDGGFRHSNTTRDRLSAFVGLVRKNGKLYIDEETPLSSNWQQIAKNF